jgi:hypothetical protein
MSGNIYSSRIACLTVLGRPLVTPSVPQQKIQDAELYMFIWSRVSCGFHREQSYQRRLEQSVTPLLEPES